MTFIFYKKSYISCGNYYEFGAILFRVVPHFTVRGASLSDALADFRDQCHNIHIALPSFFAPFTSFLFIISKIIQFNVELVDGVFMTVHLG